MITRKDLEDREGVSPDRRRARRPLDDKPAAEQETPAVRAIITARIAEAKALKAERGPDMHCGHCYGHGRDAVIRLIEGALEE